MDRIITKLTWIVFYSSLFYPVIYFLLGFSVIRFYGGCGPWTHDLELCMDQVLEEIRLLPLVVACWKSVTILIVIWRHAENNIQLYLVHPSLNIQQDSWPSASEAEEHRLNRNIQTRQARRTCQGGSTSRSLYYHQ